MYLEHATPAPEILRQNPISNPTPPTPFVPHGVGGVGFLCGFWHIWGAGVVSGGDSRWFGLGVREKDFRGGAEGQMRGSGRDRRVIDDDRRGFERAEKGEEVRLRGRVQKVV